MSKAFDLELSIEQYPFLESHVIDGKAVLPMAVMIEWMAHGAIHNNPGLRFHGFNDLRILKGVILEADEAALRLEVDGEPVRLEFSNIAKARLVPDFDALMAGKKD